MKPKRKGRSLPVYPVRLHTLAELFCLDLDRLPDGSVGVRFRRGVSAQTRNRVVRQLFPPAAGAPPTSCPLPHTPRLRTIAGRIARKNLTPLERARQIIDEMAECPGACDRRDTL
ncbi:MAG: hypothetical protein KDH88_17620 [Chromatiales bacterium]|nr:hypothetical protein [Chromatiales bacterium]